MKYAVCTTFSKDGYEQYGRACIESFKKYWPKDIPLLVYDEEDLLRDSDFLSFLESCPPDSKDYRWKARKFAWKVFTYTDPNRPDSEFWIWLDADTETFKPVTYDFLQNACPGGFVCSYLGRDGWHTSECGWLGFHQRYAGDFLKRMRSLYMSGEIFEHMEWHDSYLFDRVKEEFPDNFFHNLSKGIKGMHPWDETILGECIKHKKGPLRKAGVKSNQVPKGYWSAKE